jgi:hypothetical protein
MIAGLMAGWAASAAADLPPLPPPPITVPSLSIPTVTVPPVTTPPVTTPSVPQSPRAAPAPNVPGVTLPSVPSNPSLPGVGGARSGGGAGGTGGSNGAEAPGGAQSSGGTIPEQRAGTSTRRVYRLHLARDWITRSGPNNRRRTTLVFVLHRRMVVEFIVIQIAPDCRRIGRFRVRGHRGVNRVQLRGRLGRHSLAPGTSRILARALPGGRTISETRLVIVQDMSQRAIRAARGANACPRAAVSGNGSMSGAPDPPAGSRPGVAGREKTAKPAQHRGVLGAKFARRAFSAAKRVPLWLDLLFGFAVAMLMAAALLPKAAPAGLTASLVCGLTGAAALLLVTIVYALF